MNQADAAIFDMDGVLVDTYQAHYRSWLEMARAAGLDFSEEGFRQTFGRTSREVIATLWAGRSLSEAADPAMERRRRPPFAAPSRRRSPSCPAPSRCCNPSAGKVFAWQ